jgi:hypothetical protein
VIEPNAKLTFFASRNFALTAGLGYFIGLTGSGTASHQNQDFSQKNTFDQDESNGLRLRLGASLVLDGAHRPQIGAGYQFTGAGRLKFEKTEKFSHSGHSFVVSYTYPILFDDSVDEGSQGRRGSSGRRDRNNRQRKPSHRKN